MNLLMRWTLIFAVMMLLMETGHAWNIGQKNYATGSTIHSTHFLTPHNAAFPVHAKAYLGYLMNGSCTYATAYDLGSDSLQTGDTVNIDGFALKSLVGGGYTCMTVFYTSQQTARETFQLYFDGINYNLSQPAIAQITLL